eukprot:TRINITY_DN6698_c0_g1_i1.p1 TRINITY_DN6698_c0_g1~~TRINITY_DN6698_c0_g1_i1.p1  ORF type:complete len:511 (+),score=113.82 TRINITY_DN6698_c0_g1_i1:64-1596(+)
MRRTLLASFSLLYVLASIHARIIPYKDLVLHGDQSGNYAIQQTVGMYAPNDTPAGSGNPSFVDIELTLTRDVVTTVGNIDIVIFHDSDLTHVGYHYDDGSIGYCCSNELYDEEECATPLEFLSDDGTKSLQQWSLHFSNGSDSVKLKSRYNIKTTGLYYLMFVGCNPEVGDVYINGFSQWKNPYGYLPGQFYVLLPLYMMLTIGYSVLAFIWLVLSGLHWRELSKLQGFIGIIIIVGLIEMSIIYSYWNEQNENGKINISAEIAGTFFNVLKRTVSRVLLLLVCMGYGVVRPTLGTNMPKVMFFGVIYFIFAGILEIIEDVHMNSGVNAFVRLIFVIPVAALDTGFIWVLMRSLNHTIESLKLRKQNLKLDMYNKLSYVLMTSVVISILCAFAQMLAESSGENGTAWETYWLIQIYWHGIYFAILVSICVLWRPCENNMRYAYSEELGDNDDDVEENLQPLTTLGDAKLRSHEGPSTKASKSEMKPLAPAKFSIDEDDEVDAITETSKLQ